MVPVYFYIEKKTHAIRRIDSDMIEPLHDAGYLIIRINPDYTEDWLFPNDELKEDYIQESKYGEIVILQSVVDYIVKNGGVYNGEY